MAGALISGLIGVGQLIAYLAGLKIHGKSPAAGGTILLSVLLMVCAAGMWRLWYGAVLGFMALLAIVATLFSLLLIEACNVLGVVVAVVVVGRRGLPVLQARAGAEPDPDAAVPRPLIPPDITADGKLGQRSSESSKDWQLGHWPAIL